MLRRAVLLGKEASRDFVRDLNRAYWILIKIMVPALLIVKFLEEAGFTSWLGAVLQPLMQTIGLPDELGLVWAAAMLTNIYTALVVFYELGGDQTYTVAEMSLLGTLILLSHALPVEGAVARMMGVPWWLTLLLRVAGAYLLAFLVYQIYRQSGSGEALAELLWRPVARDPGWLPWLAEQAELLVSIYLILAALMCLLRSLRWLGIERLLQALLLPITRLLQVDRNAAQVTIIGLLLGLSFGAGLLVDESRKGHIAKRDMRVVVCFLGLCHSLIEDTLLILLLGSELWVILGMRLLFALVVMAVLARILFRRSADTLRSSA